MLSVVLAYEGGGSVGRGYGCGTGTAVPHGVSFVITYGGADAITLDLSIAEISLNKNKKF